MDGDDEKIVLVPSLDTSNFDNTILNYPLVFVRFYASYRGMDDDDEEADDLPLPSWYVEAAELLSMNVDYHDKVLLAKVNVVKEKFLANKYAITSCPKIIIFNNHSGPQYVHQQYNGFLDAQAILRYSYNLLSHNNNNNYANFVIVAYFTSFSGKEYQKFTKVAEQFKSDYNFQTLQHDHLCCPLLVKLFTPMGFVHKIYFDVDALLKFLKYSTARAVTTYPAPDDVIDYTDPLQRVAKFFCCHTANAKVMLFVDWESDGARATEFVKRYGAVANHYREEGIYFMFGEAKASQDAYWFFNLHKGFKTPLIVIRTIDGGCYWKGKLESLDEIGAFVGDYKAGRLPNQGKNIGPVKVNEVDAQSFQKFVDSGENVFLELGPWCQWCEQCVMLVPTLNAVAICYETESNVTVAKLFDNDPEIRRKGLCDDPYTVKDRPTLHFKRASWKKFILYHGLRTEDCIIEFIETNKDEATRDKPDEIESVEQVNNLIGVIVVGIFPEFVGQEFDNFCDAANKLKSDYEFRIMNAKNRPDEGYDSAVWLFTSYQSYKEPSHETKNFKVDDLVKFVKKKSSPLITFYGKNYPQLLIDRFFYCEHDKVMLFIDRKGAGAAAFESKYLEVAKSYRGEARPLMYLGPCKYKQLSFMLGDLEDSKEALSLYLDIEKIDEPFIVIMKVRSDIYMKEYLKSVDDIEDFVKYYKAGEVDVKYKKVSGVPDRASVIGRYSFQERFMESEKNVFLVLYGGSWVNMTEVAYVLDDLVIYLKKRNVDDVLVARMGFQDCYNEPAVLDALTRSLHRLRTLSKDDKPTFFFIKKDRNAEIGVYNGKITLNNILHFIKEQV